MTAAMEMYNWLHEKHSQFKKFLKLGSFSLERLIHDSPDLMPNICNLDHRFYDRLFDKTMEVA
jgi:hypothetical protein